MSKENLLINICGQLIEENEMLKEKLNYLCKYNEDIISYNDELEYENIILRKKLRYRRKEQC